MTNPDTPEETIRWLKNQITIRERLLVAEGTRTPASREKFDIVRERKNALIPGLTIEMGRQILQAIEDAKKTKPKKNTSNSIEPAIIAFEPMHGRHSEPRGLDVQSKKREFLHKYGVKSDDKNKAWAESWKAAVARNKTYKDGLLFKDRKEMSLAAQSLCNGFIKDYWEEVSEEKHLANISSISQIMTERFGHNIEGGLMRIGTTQKFFNLYLKHLWCMGKIKNPPHCPLDRIVQGSAGIPDYRRINWTTIDTIEEYLKAIESLKAGIEGKTAKTLAEWELTEGFPL